MVRLRPLTGADLDVFERDMVGPEGRGELQWFGYHDLGKLRRGLAGTGLLTDEKGWLAVEADGRLAGRVQWFRNNWGPPQTSWCWAIGILLLPEQRGKGVGTQAQRQLAAYLFDHTRAERIQACTELRNVAEQRALEKAGFAREGVLSSAIWRAGGWHDAVLYAATRSTEQAPTAGD